MNLNEYLYRILNYIDSRYQTFYNFRDSYYFIDRANNHQNLLIILAGKKVFLWDSIFPRIYSSLDDKIDVIIVNPGDINSIRLKSIANDYGFSYLATKSRKLSTALNFGIKEHQNANWIYKIDDDTFISKYFFKNLRETYKRSENSANRNPGMIVPVLNINTYTFYPFLRTLDLIEDYTKLFGNIKVGTHSTLIRSSGEVAIWIWKRSLPIEDISKIFIEKNHNLTELCPFRFSISAILFKRDLWERMIGFQNGLPGSLGIDELSINRQILIHDLKEIIVSLDTFVGHFSYVTQEDLVKKFFLKHKELFETN